jgi:Caspase domain
MNELTDPTRALLIGVDDYTTFDDSGKSNLKGSRNDVALLASYLMEVLGVRPENIIALCTPTMTEHDLKQYEQYEHYERLKEIKWEQWRGATGEDVRKGLDWLLDGSKKGTALLTFSGHGAALSGGEPALCLGDTAKDFPSGVLPLRALRDQVKNAGANERLIALFDCCHVASRSPHERLRGTALPSARTAEDVARRSELFQVSDRVLLAARPGKHAYQMRLGGRWHGALTFTLVTAAERWLGENEMSHGAYKHVMKRAKGSLAALGVPQKPELLVPDKQLMQDRNMKIRNHPFLGVKPGPTQRKPDAAKVAVQLNPDYYTIKDANGFLWAEILATGDSTVTVIVNGSRTDLTPKTEFWYTNTESGSFGASGITIKGSLGVSPNQAVTCNDRQFSSLEATDWTQDLPLPVDTSLSIFSAPSDRRRSPPAYVVFGRSADGHFTNVQWYQRDQPATGSLFTPGTADGTPYSPVAAVPPGCWGAKSL